MKYKYSLFFIFIATNFYAQKNDLSQINTIIEAEKFIDSNTDVFATIDYISTTLDSLDFYQKELENRAFTENIKVLEHKTIVAIKVNYIFFDGKELSKKNIDLKRKEILDLYEKGTSSDDLVAEFTMDRNVRKGGNFGWIDEKKVESTFWNAVIEHKKDDVFIVDVPEYKWYYVVFKLYDDIEKVGLYYLKVH